MGFSSLSFLGQFKTWVMVPPTVVWAFFRRPVNCPDLSFRHYTGQSDLGNHGLKLSSHTTLGYVTLTGKAN